MPFSTPFLRLDKMSSLWASQQSSVCLGRCAPVADTQIELIARRRRPKAMKRAGLSYSWAVCTEPQRGKTPCAGSLSAPLASG